MDTGPTYVMLAYRSVSTLFAEPREVTSLGSLDLSSDFFHNMYSTVYTRLKPHQNDIK